MRRRTIAVIAVLMIAGAIGYMTVRSAGTESTPTPPPIAATTIAPAPMTTAPPPTSIAAAEPPAPTSAAAQIEETALLATRAVFSWRPGVDASPSDAYARARPWFTTGLAERTIVSERPERGPGVEWEQWAADGAVIEPRVTVGCSGCPPDTENTIYRVVTVRQDVFDDTGHTVSTIEPDTTVWLTFVREDNGNWLIDEFRY